MGCIPPWISQLNNEVVCNDDIKFDNKKQAQQVKSQLLEFTANMWKRRETNFEVGCKLPCTQKHFTVQTISHKMVSAPHHYMAVKFEEDVEILEEKSNYSEFDLIVEIGSSLGLWLGMSVLGIYDLLTNLTLSVIGILESKRRNGDR